MYSKIQRFGVSALQWYTVNDTASDQAPEDTELEDLRRESQSLIHKSWEIACKGSVEKDRLTELAAMSAKLIENANRVLERIEQRQRDAK